MSWALHRIDDRLIHGQVLVAWGSRLDPARIWVVDDGVAASSWERDLFRDAAPASSACAAAASATLATCTSMPGKEKVNDYVYLDERDREEIGRAHV